MFRASRTPAACVRHTFQPCSKRREQIVNQQSPCPTHRCREQGCKLLHTMMKDGSHFLARCTCLWQRGTKWDVHGAAREPHCTLPKAVGKPGS
jgi:hypothetical protein